MLEIKHLKKAFGDVVPIKDISCKIEPGEVISIIGPSGTGKSTLLRCINGLEQPTEGEILYNGVNLLDPATDLCEMRKHIGMIFQSFNLFPHLTVLQNVMVPQMDLLGRSKQEAYDKAVSLLKQVGLFEKASVFPDALSGGQKQRVAIARTLGMDNEVILLDEPTSALDPSMVGEVEGVIRKLKETGKTMLIVTHEMRFAKSVASRVFFLSDGVIWEDGPPEQIFDHPLKEKTRNFVFRVHECSLDINSPDFDFYEMLTEITRFGERNDFSFAGIERLRSVFEELVVIGMVPKMKANDRIHVDFQCSDVSNAVSMTIFFTEMDFDPEKDMDAVSRAIYQRHLVSQTMAVSDRDGFAHQLNLEIIKG